MKRAYCECPNYERIINALTSPPPAPVLEGAGAASATTANTKTIEGGATEQTKTKAGEGESSTAAAASGSTAPVVPMEIVVDGVNLLQKEDNKNGSSTSSGTTTTSTFVHNYITPERLNKMCKITPGIPLKPMLAKPSKGIHEVLERLANTKFTAEYKYDGERAQVHVYKTKSGKIEYRVYSRNSENMTVKYPDVIEIVKKNLGDGVTSLILWQLSTRQASASIIQWFVRAL